MKAREIAIRVDGCSQTGLGHISRCLALAHAFRQQSWSVFFILRGEENVGNLLAQHGFSHARIDPQRDLEQTSQILLQKRIAALVVDSYQIDTVYLERIRASGALLVVLDDTGFHPGPADVILNASTDAASLAYPALPFARLLVGPQYTLLAPEFALKPPPHHHAKVQRVLITIGGSDPHDLFPSLIKWVHRILPDAAKDMVVGPFFRRCQEIQDAIPADGSRFYLHYAPAELRGFMLEADLAVCGGGQTASELAATGTPAVAICFAENQLRHLRELEHAGTLVVAGQATAPELESSLVARLKELSEDCERRQRMGQRGLEVMDGHGAARVANEILSLVSSKCEVLA